MWPAGLSTCRYRATSPMLSRPVRQLPIEPCAPWPCAIFAGPVRQPRVLIDVGCHWVMRFVPDSCRCVGGLRARPVGDPARTKLTIRNTVDSRLNRTGLATINPTRRANSRPGNSHRNCGANRSGNTTCNPIATIIATATGHRFSPRVTRSHAGTCT